MGELSNIMVAILVMCVGIVALSYILGDISGGYAVQSSPHVQELRDLAQSNTDAYAQFANSSSRNVTQNEYDISIVWLTSGTFSILSNILFTFPATLMGMVQIFIVSIQDAVGIDSQLYFVVISAIATIITASVMFYIMKAILKVDI